MRRGWIAASACGLLALALSACGGSSAQNQQAAGNAGPALAANIRLADCNDWKQESAGERLATIHALTGFYGQPIGAGTKGAPTRAGATLTDKQAYELF